MSWIDRPARFVKSCRLCKLGVIDAIRKDGMDGLHLFRCPCSPERLGKSGRFPLWTDEIAKHFNNLKETKNFIHTKMPDDLEEESHT